jgi:hypothetical protein
MTTSTQTSDRELRSVVKMTDTVVATLSAANGKLPGLHWKGDSMVRASAVVFGALICFAAAPASRVDAQQAPAAPAPCRIFITEEDPAARLYTMVRKEVSATKKFYGSHDDTLMWQLADEADKAGVDAIIKFRETRQITKGPVLEREDAEDRVASADYFRGGTA